MINNPKYLQKEQYKDSTNLNARAALHMRFTKNPGWINWVFDQIHLQSSMQILELGCGTAALWLENLSRLIGELHIVLSDISFGILREDKRKLLARPEFGFANLDATYLPMASRVFDAVIANHMLYHVPNLPQTIREIGRVLKPSGCLYSTTMGPRNFTELHELLREFEPRYFLREPSFSFFGLQNASEILGQDFEQVEIRYYDDELMVTQAKPLVDYVFSGWDFQEILDHQEKELNEFFSEIIEKKGGIRITKETGIVIARPKG